MTQRRRVVVAYKWLPRYRLAFFNNLRKELETHNINLDLYFGRPSGGDAEKRDSVALPWAQYRRNRVITLAGRSAIWQPLMRDVCGADLIIVEQASKLLLNYLLLARQEAGRERVAFWGHGANLQQHTANTISEAVKRKVSRWPYWWFAYTLGTRNRVMALGYPADRITIVQNAIDTMGLRSEISALKSNDIDEFLQRHGLTRGRVGIFIGSLYREKRLEYLMEAATHASRLLPGFKLLIAGDGPMRSEIQAFAQGTDCIRFLGRVDGESRALALGAADLTLMPGLVGLAILDSFAAQAPLVTTDIDYHSPEIEYLSPGRNGLLLQRATKPSEYGKVVVRTLSDASLMRTLREGCDKAAGSYTNEAMVANFVEGVLKALDGGRPC